MDAFRSPQHVYAEIERLDTLIRAQVWRVRQAPAPTDDLRPYYISEQEVDTLLERPTGAPPWAVVPLPEEMRQELQAGLDRMETAIAGRKEIGRQQGVIYRLDELARLFQLTPFDLDVVLFCLAPEMDQRYTRLYAYLQDDLSKPAPTVDMLVNLLCASQAERVNAWQRLGPQAPLRRHQLLGILPPTTSLEQPFSGRTLRLDERVRPLPAGGRWPGSKPGAGGRTVRRARHRLVSRRAPGTNSGGFCRAAWQPGILFPRPGGCGKAGGCSGTGPRQ